MAGETLIGPDRPDRWTDQIRHIDTYQTRPDKARDRALSDPCGEQGDGQVSGGPGNIRFCFFFLGGGKVASVKSAPFNLFAPSTHTQPVD